MLTCRSKNVQELRGMAGISSKSFNCPVVIVTSDQPPTKTSTGRLSYAHIVIVGADWLTQNKPHILAKITAEKMGGV